MPKLTTDQQRAIDYFESPLLITGPSGAGKTTVIARKVARILEEKENDRVLVLSGSHKAVRDMAAWVGQLVAENAQKVRFDKLERVCLEWLRTHAGVLGMNRHFAVYDDIEQLRIVIELAGGDDASDGAQWVPRDAIQHIRRLKLSGISPEMMADGDPGFSEALRELYRAYQLYLTTSHAIDREDIVGLALRLVTERPELCQGIANRYQYWIIDQYEDFGPVYSQLVAKIAPYLTHLTLCGDSEQAVGVEWGATGDAIIQASRHFVGLETICLTTVFRSISAIVDTSQSLRRDRKSVPNDDDFIEADDESLVYFLAFDEQEEARYVVDEIKSLRRQDMLSLNDFCILYRTQSQAYFFEEQLRQQALRFRSIGRSVIYANYEIRDILLYMRVLFNPADRQALAQLLALPPFQLDEPTVATVLRHIPPTPAGILELQGKELKIEMDIDAKLIGLIDLLAHWHMEIREDPAILAATIMSQIADDSGYRMLLEEENTVEAMERLQTIDEFIGVALEHQWSVEQLLNYVAVTTPDDAEINSGDAVNLIPLRSAKGYEFPCVFVCGLEEGLIPHSNAQFQPEVLAEERRLLYIGMSRGSKHVILTSAFRRSMVRAEWVDDVSRFIKELPRTRLACFFSDRLAQSHEMLIDRMNDEGFNIQTWLPHPLVSEPQIQSLYGIGEAVEHASWGRGVIKKIEGVDDKVILHIQFGEHERKLMAKYADVLKV